MSMVTRRKSIVEDRDTVMRMVRAHVKGSLTSRRIKSSARVLSKQLKITDRETLENSYETYKQDFISVPYPITKGLEATYDYVAQSGRRSATVSPKNLSTRASSQNWRRAGLSKGSMSRNRKS